MNNTERRNLRNKLNQIRWEINKINPDKELIFGLFDVIDDLIDRDAKGMSKQSFKLYNMRKSKDEKEKPKNKD